MKSRMPRRGRHALGVVAVIIVLTDALSVSIVAKTSKWWRSVDVQRELELTEEQIAKLDAIFNADLSERRRRAEEEKELDRRLEAVLRDGVEDTRTVYPLVEKVARVHAMRNVSRTLMLVRMYKVLNAEQRQRLRRRMTAQGTSPTSR